MGISTCGFCGKPDLANCFPVNGKIVETREGKEYPEDMTYQLTPAEALKSVQDSIASAESIYEGRDTVFATERQVDGIRLAMERIIPGIARGDRLATLQVLFKREGRVYSSHDMTLAGASALRERLYGPDVKKVEADTPMQPTGVTAVREAYKRATGQMEMFT